MVERSEGALQTRGSGGDAALARHDGEMLDPAESLRDEIAASRRQVADSLAELHTQVEENLDWKRWVEEHPLECAGAAFFVGLLIGARPYL